MRLLTAIILSMLVLVAGCAPHHRQSNERSDVGVQMFQWNWDSIAEQCTNSLGPAGIAWVLTSPPQEHILGQQWWTSYQPVSYELESRLGNEQQFKQMVATCKQAGVEIVADAVINHMTGQEEPGLGTGGSEYQHYEYPGIYGPQDFHQCGSIENDIGVYSDAFEVQNCELVNLADLKTESSNVQQEVVNYLNRLTELGVAGFRIDAAKHIPAADIQAIISKLKGEPRIILEVIRAAGEPIQPEDYLESGSVFEFSWGKDMKSLSVGSTFASYFKAGTKQSYVPSEKAYTFIENHDTERNGTALTYADPQYEVFTALMLANPYGTPVLYSGYAFTDHDRGAKMDPLNNRLFDATCVERTSTAQEYTNGDYTCQHNWPTVRNMIAWRKEAGNAPMVHQWSEGDGLAFARDGVAFIAVNRGSEPLTGNWQTSLEPGEYCNGGAAAEWTETCVTGNVTVAQDGSVAATIAPYSVLALVDSQRE